MFYKAFMKVDMNLDGVRLRQYKWGNSGRNQFFLWEGKMISITSAINVGMISRDLLGIITIQN